MLTTYVAFFFLTSYRRSPADSWPFSYALIGALLFALVLGVLFEFLVIRRAKEPNILNLIILTLGFQLMLYGLAGWKWGPNQQRFPFPSSDTDTFELGPVVVSELNLVTILTAAVLMTILFLFFRFTKQGIAMQATQQNPMAARINGIRTKRVLAYTFGISSVIGAIAAMLIAPVTTLDPNLMWDPLLKGFAASVLGGMTSLVGAALGGYLLGIIENLFGAYVSLEFKSVVAFALIVVVLWFKPSGLFARHYERKV
jgi:branched-chain amino acid transport system permease protein